MDRAVFIHNTLRDFVSHLGFRVADNYIVVRNEESVCHFPLCRKGFSASRRSQDQAVGVFKLLAIAEYHVVGKSVQPIIKACAPLKKLLRDKRDKDRRAGSRQAPLYGDKVLTDRDA